MIQSNNWYVYRHIRDDINMPFYVGVGCKKNYARAYEGWHKRNKFWKEIASKTPYCVDIILDNLSKKEAFKKEIEFISIYGREDLKSGTLINLTGGGEGLLSFVYSNEFKKKLSDSKLGNKNPMFGVKQSNDTIKKRAEKLKGIKKTEEQKLNQSLCSVKSGQAKSVKVYLLKNNEFIGKFHSVAYACKELSKIYDKKISDSKACMVANGKRSNHHGFVFIY